VENDLDLLADDSPKQPSKANPKGPLSVAPEPPPDRRVDFFIEASNLTAAAERALEILATHPDGGRVFRRKNGLALVDQCDGDARLVELTKARLNYELGRCAIAKVLAKTGKFVPNKFPQEVLEQVLSGTCPATSKLRRIAGLSATPFFAPDGSIVTAVGYHAASRYLVVDDALQVRVREKPTREHAVAALAALRDVFVDFPYPEEADRHVPIAALLTLLAAPAIEGNLPGFLFDATTAGSGKTLQQDVISMVATGHTSRKQAWIRDEDERRKSMMASALAGGPILAIDNVSRDVPFGGDLIDMLLTSGGHLAFRGLGASELLEVDWRPVILASGNNIGLTGDTNRRVLRARMQTNEENPENRTSYVHPERADRLVVWAKENRAKLVAAGLTILRAYHVAGRPSPLKLGSFDGWSALVPSAIAWAGGPDVLTCVPRGDDVATDTDSDLRAFMAAWPSLVRMMSGAWSARDLVSMVWRTERENDDLTDLRDAVTDALRTKPGHEPSTKAVGKMLARWRGRVIGGRRLVSSMNAITHTLTWSVETVTKGEKK
jgi:putative DNA primase/helicase